MILAEANALHTILAFFFGVFAVLLMMVILLQRGRGVGLAGAFGGAGGASATFGSKSGDVLTWITIGLTTFLLIYTVLCNYAFVPQKAGLGGGPTPPTAAPNTAIEPAGETATTTPPVSQLPASTTPATAPAPPPATQPDAAPATAASLTNTATEEAPAESEAAEPEPDPAAAPEESPESE
jgi:preprotein translocase subunit SecG